MNIPPTCPPLTTHAAWTEAAARLLAPLTELMEPSRAELPLRGPASNHGLPADRLESFARPCLLAAHWLHASRYHPETRAGRYTPAKLAAWFRAGLLLGVDPASDQYWGPTANYHQHTVEMGALVLALEMARDWLWEPFLPGERKLVLEWLATVRGVGLHRNNHMFFGVFPLEFLAREGCAEAGDAAFLHYLLDTLETMHAGQGWFIDGMNESVDYYNAYAFHYYGLWWAALNRKRDLPRAERWLAWAAQFLPSYAHFFASTGENPPFGRSLSYRFAASAPFALGQLLGVEGVPPGQARRLCRLNVEYFLNQPITQEQGAISLGWGAELPAVAEAYSCAGSPYWAAKGFAPLLLPPDHTFWTAQEELLPAELGNHSLPLPAVGLVVRSTGGAVELLNAQSMICGGNSKFGVWKWGRLSYRTGAGYLVPSTAEGVPPDAALVAQDSSGVRYGRHSTYPLAMEADHIASVYALGERFTQFNIQVRSYLWWRGPWQLHLHFYVAQQPATLQLGSYSLAADQEDQLTEGPTSIPGFYSGGNGILQVAAQILHGFEGCVWEPGEATDAACTHLSGPASRVLVLSRQATHGAGWLAALNYAGPWGQECSPWTVDQLDTGKWRFSHPGGSPWVIEHPVLPATSARG